MTGFNTINPQVRTTQAQQPSSFKKGCEYDTSYPQWFNYTDDMFRVEDGVIYDHNNPGTRPLNIEISLDELIHQGLDRSQKQIDKFSNNAESLSLDKYMDIEGNKYTDIDGNGSIDKEELLAMHIFQDTNLNGETSNKDTIRAIKKLDGEDGQMHQNNLKGIYNLIKSVAGSFTTPFKVEGNKIIEEASGKEISKDDLIKEGLDRSKNSLASMDKDGDYQTSVEEYQQATGLSLDGIKKSIDLNNNGLIDKYEDFTAQVTADAGGKLDGVLSISEKNVFKANLGSTDTKNAMKNIFNNLGFNEKPANLTNPIANGQFNSLERGNLDGNVTINGTDYTIQGKDLYNAEGEAVAGVHINEGQTNMHIHMHDWNIGQTYDIKINPDGSFSIIDRDLSRVSFVDEELFGQQAA